MKATDADLARVALAKGLISRERHDRVLAEADRLQALGLEKSVGDILVEDGSLTADAARSLREALGWTVTRPRVGGYEIVRRVGIGGMGTVFEARHVRLNQRIALKVLFPRLAKDPRLTERFIREARALAKLDHPHLVHAIDAGQDGEYFYLAMEFIEGENLLQRLAREGPLDPLVSLDVIRSVCEALSALEERGLVHRDVKPGNILIGAAGQVKLADLGLLKGLESSGQDDPICGTPHYMAPEQIRGTADLDARTDLYALGATWYHMVVGRPPFVGTRTVEVLEAHLSRDPPFPSRLRRGIPASMERVILRWLSKDKDARPRSTRAAIENVDRLAASLRKRRLRTLARTMGGALRRRRRAAFLVAACILAGGVVLTLTALKRHAPEPPPRSGSIAVTPLPRDPDAPPRSPAAESKETGKLPVGAGPPADMGRPSPAPVGPPDPKPPSAHATLDLPVTHESAEASMAAFLTRAASRLGTAAAEAWRGLSARARTFEPLIPLCRSFHAKYVGIEPGRSPPAGIVLQYTFESAEELLDFRAEPGSWEVREGELRGLAVPGGEPLESVAWYAPPVRMEWRLPRDAPLIVGLGSLRAAPGASHDARVWTQAGEDISVLAAPRVPAGPGWLRIDANGVEISTGGRTAYIATRVPPRGRITLRIAAQHAFSELSLEAVLDPSWGAARALFLRERR